MATGFPVKANYATGDVLTAANMNDLSGTLNYLQYLPPRNPVLNSNFSVWQRGTSFAIPSSAVTYTADRWFGFRGATGCTISRQTGSNGSNYDVRVQRDSGNISTSIIYFGQAFEILNALQYQGKTVTISFYARAGANFSGASNALAVTLNTGTGSTDSNPFVGTYTGTATPINNNITLTTSWQRFTATATLGSAVTQFTLYFSYTPVGTAGANDYFEISNVQLELGSTANTYMPNQPTYQGELAACQRYYYRQSAVGSYTTFSTFVPAALTTIVYPIIVLPVTFRTGTAASMTLETSNLALQDGSGALISGGTFTIESTQTNNQLINIKYNHGSATFTQYRPYVILANNNTSAYLGVSAEL